MRVLFTNLLVVFVLMMVMYEPAIAGNACGGQVEAVRYAGEGRFEITIHNADGNVTSARRWGERSRITFRLDTAQQIDVTIGPEGETRRKGSGVEIVNWFIEAYGAKAQISFLWMPVDEQWKRMQKGEGQKIEVMDLRSIYLQSLALTVGTTKKN